jgi:hypothetical protein
VLRASGGLPLVPNGGLRFTAEMPRVFGGCTSTHPASSPGWTSTDSGTPVAADTNAQVPVGAADKRSICPRATPATPQPLPAAGNLGPARSPTPLTTGVVVAEKARSHPQVRHCCMRRFGSSALDAPTGSHSGTGAAATVTDPVVRLSTLVQGGGKGRRLESTV